MNKDRRIFLIKAANVLGSTSFALATVPFIGCWFSAKAKSIYSEYPEDLKSNVVKANTNKECIVSFKFQPDFILNIETKLVEQTKILKANSFNGSFIGKDIIDPYEYPVFYYHSRFDILA